MLLQQLYFFANGHRISPGTAKILQLCVVWSKTICSIQPQFIYAPYIIAKNKTITYRRCKTFLKVLKVVLYINCNEMTLYAIRAGFQLPLH